MKMVTLRVMSGLLLLLQACATAPTGPVPVEERSNANKVGDAEKYNTPGIEHENRSRSTDPVTESISRQAATPAVIALLDSAEREANIGNRESAAAALERALRLEPKNALLWHRFAQLRLQQSNWQQALAMARKSNALASGNYPLQMENWRVILHVKESVRDIEGAEHARNMLEQLSGK